MRIGPGTRSLLQVRVAPCSEWRVVKQVRREPPGARLREPGSPHACAGCGRCSCAHFEDVETEA